METCKCFCSIIPPHIIDHLEKKGDVKIHKEGIKLDLKFRIKRANKNLFLQQEMPSAIAGQALRKIFDSQHGDDLRIDLKRQEGDNVVSDQIVNTVYDNAGIVRNFFKNKLSYNSVDNNGADLIFNVHYGKNFCNAFWDGDEIVIGDGDDIVFINLGNSLDVTAHELTHGVVQHTSGLVYVSQAGALNEHMADVFGVTIRQYAEGQTGNPQQANWLIGDTIMGPSLQGQAIRNMKEPGTAYDNLIMGKDPQPAHMDNYYFGTDDNYGVHINSGIPNKVFYLVSVELNDTVKAAKLWFRTLQSLRPNATFKTFKRKLLSASFRMSLSGQLPFGIRRIVKDAFRTVGL